MTKRKPPSDSETERSSERLNLLTRALEASSCSVVIADARAKDLPLIYVNSAFEKITGYPSKEVLGLNCRFLQGKDTKQAGLEVLRKAIKRKKDCDVLIRNYRKDGTLFWNELRLAPVFDSAQNLTHYIGVQTDVTERVKAEQSIEEHNRQLEEKIRQRTRQLEEKNLALREILGQIESEKRQIKEQVTRNVDRLILPLLKKMRTADDAGLKQGFKIIEKNLEDLTSSFGSQLSRKMIRLTPREIEICNLIRGGLSTKGIAQFLHVSPDTVENQRGSIRKKLDISGRNVNLTTYLQNMAAAPES